MTVNKGKKKVTSNKKPQADAEIRLNKFIANSGVCSRRDADELIKKGLIKVNGKVIDELGVKIKATDNVEYNGKKLNSEKKVYLLLNKTKDAVTTAYDPQGRRTVLDLVQNACSERIYPVGRLDRNTTGVLLLTNDGDMAKKLAHPSSNTKKIYHAFLNKPFTKNDFIKMMNGVTLEDGFIKPDQLSYPEMNDKIQVGIEIHSGKNRIVRRIFEHLGYEVVKLDRVYFAGLTKKNVKRGKWRFLTEKEINTLKMLK